MSATHPDQTETILPDGTAPRRPWHAPELQECDVIETQFGSGSYQPSDTTTYGS